LISLGEINSSELELIKRLEMENKTLAKKQAETMKTQVDTAHSEAKHQVKN
jgi:hypothetical protein